MKVDLDRLIFLESNATPGPFVACSDILNNCVSISVKGVVRKDLFRTYDFVNMQSSDDARLLSEIRNNIKELCLELKAAREVVKQCEYEGVRNGLNPFLSKALEEYEKVINEHNSR